MAALGNIGKVKIFLLYLMRNINYPLDFVTVNEIVMQTDYIMFLDFEEAFHQMLEGELICKDGKNENGDDLYSVTRKGAMVAEQLKSDILPSILDQSLACALRYLDFQRRGVTLDSHIERVADATFDVSLTIKEKAKVIYSTTINVDSEYRAHQVASQFREHPEIVYRGSIALLCGNVNYLFEQK